MDTVPFKFVDAVVQFFNKHTLNHLAKTVSYSIWKEAIDLHSQNRRYYDLYIDEKEDQFVITIHHHQLDEYMVMQELQQADQRFLRFRSVSCNSIMYLAEHTLVLQKEDHDQLGKILSPQFVDPYAKFSTSSRLCETMNRCLFRRVYFHQLRLSYDGTASEEFLKDHIDNNPNLHGLWLFRRWPEAIQPYLRKYILKTGMQIYIMYEYLQLNSELLGQIIKTWKETAYYQCTVMYGAPKEVIDNAMPFLNTMHLLDDGNGGRTFYLKHETRKSVAAYDILHTLTIALFYIHDFCGSADCYKCERYWPTQ